MSIHLVLGDLVIWWIDWILSKVNVRSRLSIRLANLAGPPWSVRVIGHDEVKHRSTALQGHHPWSAVRLSWIAKCLGPNRGINISRDQLIMLVQRSQWSLVSDTLPRFYVPILLLGLLMLVRHSIYHSLSIIHCCWYWMVNPWYRGCATIIIRLVNKTVFTWLLRIEKVS